MYRRDYLIRLIERFGLALRTLRDRILRRQVDRQAVRAAVGEMARDAGLDLDIARHLDPASLLLWLAPTGEVDEPRLWLMAELLSLEAWHARESGAGDGRGDFERALAIYDRLTPGWRPNEDFPTVAERAAEIRAVLQPDA